MASDEAGRVFGRRKFVRTASNALQIATANPNGSARQHARRLTTRYGGKTAGGDLQREEMADDSAVGETDRLPFFVQLEARPGGVLVSVLG